MGLIAKKENNKYQISLSENNELIHDKEWLSEDEAKTVLINRIFYKFIEDVIKIDMDFPIGLNIIPDSEKESKFNEWLYKTINSDEYEIICSDKFKELYQRLKLEFKIL